MFLYWRREQSIDWYGLNENNKVFNEQLLIKRADNVQRKVTNINQNTCIYCGNDFNLHHAKNTCAFPLHYPAFLRCRLALYCVQNKDDHE